MNPPYRELGSWVLAEGDDFKPDPRCPLTHPLPHPHLHHSSTPMDASGKTTTILSRLPAFYDAGNTETLMYQMVSVFGQLLLQTETDLFRVMRSHFVDTADNEGSQGLTSLQQGDLDQIFLLYLEALGLTSQLNQVNPSFRLGVFKNLPGFGQRLKQPQGPMTRVLVQGFASSTQGLVAAFPAHPTEQECSQLEAALIAELNASLQRPALYQHYLKHFPADSLSPETQRLLRQKPTRGLALQTLNRSILETVFANDIEKSYAPYRDRLKVMMRVLRQGAATKGGIRDIVAANLGIFDDDEAAKDQIQIEEFLPELTRRTVRIHPYTAPPNDAASVNFQYEQTFSIENPNVIPTRSGFQLQLLDVRPGSGRARAPLQPLINPRIVNADTQERFEYQGMLQVNDVLRVTAEGDLYLNGVAMPAQKLPPPLPRDTSRWYVELRVGEPAGHLDQTLFDLSRFDRAGRQPALLTPEQASNYAIALDVELIKQTPASFRVRIPWDIPGYTDKFSEAGDHPRNQIPDILDKVKAAGVLAVVAYEKRWQDYHTHVARLTVVRSPFTEDQQMDELNFNVGSYQEAYPGGLQHDLADTFLTSGVLDYTQFDSGNRFA